MENKINKYIIASHGCSGETTTYFNVKKNQIVVLYNHIGISSSGIPNIPFVVYLHKYNKNLFDYIFNMDNYAVNLNKKNEKSYRHSLFFHQLPFYSQINHICNMEMYDGNSDIRCPNINLTFSEKKDTFFTGIANFNNIIDFERDQSNKIIGIKFYNNISSEYIIENIREKENGEIYISLKSLLDNLGDGIYFISACRAQYYANCKGKMVHFPLELKYKGCLSYDDYDKKIINQEIVKFKKSCKTPSHEPHPEKIAENIRIY